MIRINQKFISSLLLIVVFSAVFAAGTYVGVTAYSGTVFGRKQGYGYFENEKKGPDGNGYVLSKGIKKTSVSDLIRYLKDKNKDEDSQDGTGAAFIVYTMLDKKAKDNRDRDISDSDWKDLEKRLRSLDNRGNIDWSETVSPPSGINSYHQKWTEKKTKKGKTTIKTYHDDAFYSNGSSEKSIAFYDDDGKVIYALAHKCANPMGKIGIPDPNEWDVSVKSAYSVPSASPGNTITWTHTIKNEGPDKTDQDVEYRYQDGGDLGSGHGSEHKFSSGANSGSTKSFTSTYSITQNDVGKTLCRSTSAKPRSWDNSDRITSSAACVYVPYNWSVTTSSSVKSIDSATPGHTITWQHSIVNNGPTKTNQAVTYHYQNRDGLGGSSGPDYSLAAGTLPGQTGQFTSSHTITQDDVGKNLCRATSGFPRAYNIFEWTESPAPCVFIPYNYVLTPFISSSQTGTIEANTSITLTPSVRNDGPTKSRDTQWQISQIVITPGSPIPHENTPGNSPQAPCVAYFTAAGASCSIINNGTGTTVLSVGLSTLAQRTVDAGDYEVGTKLCFAFSVQPRASSVPSNPGSDNQWAHSVPVCMIIGKKPKVQILGGDVMSGGIIQTSTSSKNISGTARMFGSWDEYAALAVGSISGMGSGAAFAGPGMANSTICKYSTLSFTNSGSSATCLANLSAGGGIGSYAIAQSMPGVAASFPVNTTDPDRNLGNNVTVDLSENNLQGIYRATGNVTINGGVGDVIKKGQWIVINAPTADVTINGNINYTNETLTTIDQIPQVIIIANNINIVDSVTNVDGWLVASGYINTCSSISMAAPLSASICDDRLTVNGAVLAQKIYLRRTAGSGVANASGDPAEVFNLRADAYLWSMARASSNRRIQTVDTIELPPRF